MTQPFRSLIFIQEKWSGYAHEEFYENVHSMKKTEGPGLDHKKEKPEDAHGNLGGGWICSST